MPYIAIKQRLAGGPADVMDCDKCLSSIPHKYRLHMACGQIPKRHWLGTSKKPTLLPVDPSSQTVCPYYSASLPQVHEVSVAWMWRDKGQLQFRYRNPPPILLDLIDQYNGSVCGANDYYMEQVKAKHNG